MRFSLTSLIRFAGLLALALCAVAIGLARAVPDMPVFRTTSAPRFFGLNGSAFFPPMPGGFLLDAETGALAKPVSTAEERVDYLTCSPWTTEPGRFEFIARMLRRDGEAPDALCAGVDLARFSQDGSRAFVGRLDLKPVVCGRPCWVPGHPNALLFAGGDGGLYRQELATDAEVWASGEPDESGADSYGATSRRTAITWGCDAPGDDFPLMSDPICPPIAAMKGRVIVTLSLARRTAGRVQFTPLQLWWLELDDDLSTIVAAGPLLGDPSTVPEHSTNALATARLANLAEGPGGRIVVAFLARSIGDSSYQIGVGALEVDPASGRPSLDPRGIRVVGTDVAATTPPLSPDGRWLYLINRTYSGGPTIQRREVAELLDDERPESVLASFRGGPRR
jgi:hypothetical protein